METFKKTSVLATADSLIHGARQDNYGGVEESFGKIAEGWAMILNAEVSPVQVSLCMIWLKVMRHVAGGSQDDWIDMAGYAGLGDELEINQEEE